MLETGSSRRIRAVVDRPADGWLTGRVELVAGHVSGVEEDFALTAWCGDRPLRVLPCLHDVMRRDRTTIGFWTIVTMREWLDEVHDGVLAVRLFWGSDDLGEIALRIAPVAVELARDYPISTERFSVPAARERMLVFPGLGGVGGASLDALMRVETHRAGGSVPVFHEADHPRLWREMARDRTRVPTFRWIGGHGCHAAGSALDESSARVTLLRDPPRRLFSVFHYNALVHPREFPFRTFESFVESGRARRWSQAEGLLRCAGVADLERLSNAELLALARRELDRAYELVGITELFEESIFLACQLGGFTSVGPWWRVLSTPRTGSFEDLPARVRTRTEQLLAADLELYAEARAAFVERLSGAGLGALPAYRAAVESAPELPAVHKAFECLRWRELLSSFSTISTFSTFETAS